MPYREPARRRTRYLRLCLDVLTKSTGCTASWEEMKPSGGEDRCTRVCSECMHEVHDVTLMTASEAEEFLAERMSDAAPKLLLYRRPDGRVMDNECARGASERRRWRVFYALMLASATAIVVTVLR